jgi:hypothetical protein
MPTAPDRSWLPKLETISVHPGERWKLDEQLPTARVYGEPIPADVAIVESEVVTVGTLRMHFADGSDVACTLGKPPPEPQQWIKCDPVSGFRFDQFGPPLIEEPSHD